jgi:hypothetical protein
VSFLGSAPVPKLTGVGKFKKTGASIIAHYIHYFGSGVSYNNIQPAIAIYIRCLYTNRIGYKIE